MRIRRKALPQPNFSFRELTFKLFSDRWALIRVWDFCIRSAFCPNSRKSKGWNVQPDPFKKLLTHLENPLFWSSGGFLFLVEYSIRNNYLDSLALSNTFVLV